SIEIFFSTTLFGLVLLILLAYKLRFGLYAGLRWGIVIGTLAGLLVPLEMGALGLSCRLWSLGLGFVTIIGCSIVVILLRFYRDPDRIPPHGENHIVSPADGKVMYVKEVQQGKVPLSVKGGKQFELVELTRFNLIEKPAYLIGIEMSILDVHVNRAPIQGKIVMQNRINGGFISLKKPEAVLRNSRLTTVIENGSVRIAVIQIASRLVRLIASYVKPGDELSLGQRLGMIKFGSQVDIVIPKLEGLQILAEAGRKVKAGVSIIAHYGED
ncbi:MAG: phosphatidylserine decarboxylase family protein, partial [Deltaproteobacteria bacterium]